jgi:Mg/Co/Ni transporter MgtE
VDVRTVDLASSVGEIPAGEGPVAVIDDAGVLLGALAETAQSLPANTPVKRVMISAPGTIRPELRIDEVIERLRKDGLASSLVTTVRGVLLGIVYTDQLHV